LRLTATWSETNCGVSDFVWIDYQILNVALALQDELFAALLNLAA